MRNDHLFMFSSDMDQLGSNNSILAGVATRPPAAAAPVAASNHQRIFNVDASAAQVRQRIALQGAFNTYTRL